MAETREVDTLITVLNKWSLNEADVGLDVISDQLGRITISSRGVGHTKSKLRYALEPYSITNAKLIMTKSGEWRLINATLHHNLFYKFSGRDRLVMVRLYDLMSRVIPPEESSDYGEQLLAALYKHPQSIVKNYLLIASGLLYEVGYLDKQHLGALPAPLTDSIGLVQMVVDNPATQTDLSQASKTKLKKEIAQSLENSQL